MSIVEFIVGNTVEFVNVTMNMTMNPTNSNKASENSKKKKSTVSWKWELLLHTNDVSSFGEEVHYGERYCPKVTVFLIVFDFLT